MKQQAVSRLIIAALIIAHFTVGAAGQTTRTPDEVKTRAAEYQTKSKEVVVKLRPGTKILLGDKAFPFEFIKSASLSGRVKETRDENFTLSSTSPRKSEVTAVISYADVVSIKRPSAFARTLKNIGKYSLLGPAAVAILPLYAVMALLGDLPSC